MLIAIICVLCIGCLTYPTTSDGFQYLVKGSGNNKGIEITRYKGTSKAVEIPEFINNLPVISIHAFAFLNKGLESVTIPSTVTSIGENAFAYNKLTSINIPSSVTVIDNKAFKGNKLSVPNVKIPDHLESRWDAIFDDFPQLIVMNKLTVPIVHIYLRPTGENKWEEIWSDQVLPDNGFITDELYRIRYDVRAEDSNRNTYTFLNMDFSGAGGSLGFMISVDPGKKDK